jgi:single-strand DNA-binding protein
MGAHSARSSGETGRIEMIQDAQVHLAGYVATEPKFKKTVSGTSSVRLRVAYTLRRQNRETGEWSDGATTFVNGQCWRGLADNVAMCLRKGEPVMVMGRLNIRRFEDSEGAQRTSVEVEANSIGHDLARGVAHFSRTRRAVGGTAAESAGEHAADGQEHGDLAEPGEERAAGTAGGEAGAVHGPPSGVSVVDESAVAEFAREISETLGAYAPVDSAVDAGLESTADAGVESTADAGVESTADAGVDGTVDAGT